MTSRGRFQLHLPGLLKVLAEHLYSTRRVGVRELIQNAHDSCVRRALERPEPGYRPRVDLTFDPDGQTLRVADNGSGLSEADIHAYLIVIGRGYTRELRDRLAIEDHDAARELVGQFGIGFLAAFLLASEVVVETRPSDGPALRWSSTGDEEFELSPGDRAEVGTTVALRLKPAALFLLHDENLADVVREYADFLPTPIHVQGSDEPVNLGAPPWSDPTENDLVGACRRYAGRRFGEADPLWVLPLTDGSVDLGHDTIAVPLRGFLFVPVGSIASIKEYGTVAVTIRGMSICDADRDLLPPWARFVEGLVEAPTLQPTASRESVHQDDSFEAVQTVLADQLAAGLRRLAEESPATWRQIAAGHSDVIMGWAARDGDFFGMVADAVPLRTSRGRLTLPEYLAVTNNVAYYTTSELGSLQDKVLAEARDVPAIDASWFAVTPFLEAYAALHPGVRLVRLDDDLSTVLRPASDPATTAFAPLVQLCGEMGFAAVVSTFHPADLPALMVYPRDAETIRDATQALEDDLFPPGFGGLIQDHVAARRAAGSGGVLHLNADNPLLRRLATTDIPPARQQAALAVVAHFARLFCGRMLGASDAVAAISASYRSLAWLVGP